MPISNLWTCRLHLGNAIMVLKHPIPKTGFDQKSTSTCINKLKEHFQLLNWASTDRLVLWQRLTFNTEWAFSYNFGMSDTKLLISVSLMVASFGSSFIIGEFGTGSIRNDLPKPSSFLAFSLCCSFRLPPLSLLNHKICYAFWSKSSNTT